MYVVHWRYVIYYKMSVFFWQGCDLNLGFSSLTKHSHFVRYKYYDDYLLITARHRLDTKFWKKNNDILIFKYEVGTAGKVAVAWRSWLASV